MEGGRGTKQVESSENGRDNEWSKNRRRESKRVIVEGEEGGGRGSGERGKRRSRKSLILFVCLTP